MKMAVFPTHGILDSNMQITKRVGFRNLDSSPNGRPYVLQCNLKLINLIESFSHSFCSSVKCPPVLSTASRVYCLRLPNLCRAVRLQKCVSRNSRLGADASQVGSLDFPVDSAWLAVSCFRQRSRAAWKYVPVLAPIGTPKSPAF